MIQQAHATGTLVIHAAAVSGRLVLWAEQAGGLRDAMDAAEAGIHPFAVEPEALAEAMSDGSVGIASVFKAAMATAERATTRLMLPASGTRVLPSSTLAFALGHASDEFGVADTLVETEVPVLMPAPEHWSAVLGSLLDAASNDDLDRVAVGPTVLFFDALTGLGLHLLAQQRFVPMLYQDSGGKLSAAWHPWLSDERTAAGVATLVRSIPPAARVALDELDHDPWRIVETYLARLIDGLSRVALEAEDMGDIVEDLDTDSDVQIGWAAGLLTEEPGVPAMPA
ncbi:MAG: hypothetical protein AAF235_02315, partial [Planctomycetota bacterium]